MSRTIKDTPARVRRNRAAGTGSRVTHLCGEFGVPCDAQRRDEQHDERRVCTPHIPGKGDRWDPYAKTARERSTRYWAPERGAVRLSLRRAIRQANTGQVDEVVPTSQHRHGTWGGGWWD